MRIFVGYGYNQRDKWIEELVFPVIEAFGDDVVDGKEVYGQALPDAIRGRIRQSDVLIAFTTRRDQISDQRWTTHHCVRDELSQALASNIPFVEVWRWVLTSRMASYLGANTLSMTRLRATGA
jgi:hypothetical protein